MLEAEENMLKSDTIDPNALGANQNAVGGDYESSRHKLNSDEYTAPNTAMLSQLSETGKKYPVKKSKTNVLMRNSN